MSFSSKEGYSSEHIAAILEMAIEPSYISEIARKLEEYYDDWGWTGNASVEKVSIAASMMDDRDDVDFTQVGYGEDNEGQEEASPLMSLTGQDADTGYKWNRYTILHYHSDTEIRDEFREAVDKSVTVDEKKQLIDTLSGSGNQVSKQAEAIMQDCLSRQFKRYDNVQTPGYNDPGIDFYVQDERNREWGLAVEISVRWVNPIDDPYLTSKQDKAIEKDADLLILAPKFTNTLYSEYEDPGAKGWHDDPEGEMVHLHRLPAEDSAVYSPFAKKPDEVHEPDNGGNPIIIPDNDEARQRLSRSNNIGDSYPVVDSNRARFTSALDMVHRDYTTISESNYRNQIRESIEPLLWEFLRPYKIEQFLIDTYWNKSLTQNEIGKLVDRTGGTIGTWMRRTGVMRRGGGAPELSDDTIEIWSRMYRGEDPFKKQFSGYRILAEYNRHPLWDLQDWKDWYSNTTEQERKETIAKQDSYRDSLGYTLMFDPNDRLQPSYSFVLSTLKDNGVEVRQPDEAPRVPYSAYPSRDSLEYMLNKNQDTIVEVDE